MSDEKYTPEEKGRLAHILNEAYALGSPSQFMTRQEVKDALDHMSNLFDSKLTNIELKQRNWVLGGCIAIVLALGGNWVSMTNKLDRVATSVEMIKEQNRTMSNENNRPISGRTDRT